MNRLLTARPLAVLIGFLMLGIWLPPQGWGQSTGGALSRHSADFQNFDNEETSTDVGVYPKSLLSSPGDDGTLVFQKTVYTPPGDNVLYVTISAAADTHLGAALWLNCRVDGSDCNPGGRAAAPGYVSLLKLPAPVAATNCDDGGGGFGDCHDNSIKYTWCTQIHPDGGTHTVELRLATSVSGATVFYETAHYFIDSNAINGNDCTPAPPVHTDDRLTDGLVPLAAAPAPALPSLPRLP